MSTTPGTMPNASQTRRGAMSAADKAKLDGIPPGGGGGPISSVTNGNGLNLSNGILAMDAAAANAAGAMTAGAQEIGGAKTFNALATFVLGLISNGAITFRRSLVDDGVSGFPTQIIGTGSQGFLFDTTGGIGATAALLLLRVFGTNMVRFTGAGRIDQYGTDSSGSPGNATIHKPIGRSAIAAGSSSVVITNNLVTAGMHVTITPHARDTTCKELIAVCTANTITVSGSAAATAALPFSWVVKGIL